MEIAGTLPLALETKSQDISALAAQILTTHFFILSVTSPATLWKCYLITGHCFKIVIINFVDDLFLLYLGIVLVQLFMI